MISVCMATYNGERFIREQIESILIQLTDVDELVISDDSSTDSTLKIIDSFNDKRIKKITQNTFHNPIYNFECALKNAQGDIIILADQDDIWVDNKVNEIKLYLGKYKYDLVVTDCSIIDENNNVLVPSIFEKLKSGPGLIKNLFKNSYLGCCMAFKKSILSKALPFPKHIPMHDIWLGFVAELFFKPYFIKKQLTLYRRHAKNESTTSRLISNNVIFKKVFIRFNLLKRIPLLIMRKYTKKNRYEASYFMHPPKISIITVCYNSEKTLQETIDSVITQSYNNIEYIIVDGASTDKTKQIIEENKAKINIFISEPDKGIYDAMNKGIKIASGDIIGILNSDDIFYDNKVIENVITCFINNNIDAVYGNIVYFKKNNYNQIVRYWKTKKMSKYYFENGNIPPHPSLFVKKIIYNEIGVYQAQFKTAADYEFMLRVFKIHQYKPYFLNQTLVKMRMGGTSTKNLKNIIIGNKEIYKAWKMNKLKVPSQLYIMRLIKKIKQLMCK